MFKVQNRLVKLVTGTSSQTINVLSDNGILGVYEPKLRIRDRTKFVTQEYLEDQHFATIDHMAEFLEQKHGARRESQHAASSAIAGVLPDAVG